jgi:TfoX/Sxy family transcriptional regulator of competence genes
MAAHDPYLAELLADAVSRRQGASSKRMFGGVCWLLHGNMLCFAQADRLMFRVGKAAEPALLELPGVEPMINAGRRMPGFLFVDADAAIDEGLDVWVQRATVFVGGLPPK